MRTIPLTKGYIAIVDDEDYDALTPFDWFADVRVKRNNVTVYAGRSIERNGKRVTLHMHRVILPNLPRVDHADGDGLNNRRYNLRPATKAQNNANSVSRLGSSRWKGVYFHKLSGKWAVSIRSNKRTTHLGLFADEADAATAYNFAALETFGEFARFNAPLEGYPQ